MIGRMRCCWRRVVGMSRTVLAGRVDRWLAVLDPSRLCNSALDLGPRAADFSSRLYCHEEVPVRAEMFDVQ